MRYVSLGIFILALVLMQLLVGGAGLVFSLPANIALGVSGVLLVFAKKESNQNPLALLTSLSTLLLGAYVIARTQFSPVEYLARWDLFLTLGAVVAYFAVSSHFVRARDRLIIIGVLAALGLVHVAVGTIQFKEVNNYMLLPGIIRSNWDWRASGFYIYPNHLAGLLEMLGLMALSICCWGRVANGVRILAGWCTLVSIGGIALTGSRGGYLSIVVGLFFFVVLSLWAVRQLRPERLWPMLVSAFVGAGLLVGGAVFVMAKSDSMKERLTTILGENAASKDVPANMRIYMWQASLQAFALSPMVGTGSGTYLYYGRQFRSPEVQADPMFVHNDYLHLLAEYGVIGAVLGGLFLIVHLGTGLAGIRRIVQVKLKPEWRTTGNELALALGALSGIMALLFHSVVDFNFHLPANLLLGAVLFAVVATPSAMPKAGATETRGVKWLPWVTPAFSVALLVLAVPLIPGEYFGELARRALRDRRYDEARALAERAISYEHENPNLWYYLGEARHYQTLKVEDALGRAALHEQAAEAYVEGLRLFPRDVRLLLKLGQTLDAAGRYDEAEEAYQQAIAGDPNFGNVYAYYGLHLQVQRRFKDAEFYFRKAQELRESEISAPALAEIDRVRKSEIGRRMLPPTPGETPEPPPAPPEPPVAQ